MIMARKVFISFLGSSNYNTCVYYKNTFFSSNVRFIQEATLDYLQTLEQWTEGDVAYILLTEGAKSSNWVDDGHRDFQTKEIIKQAGLKTCLQQKNYPFAIQTIEGLPEGKNEEELFRLFRSIFEALEPEDSLYFDITHGFRSLPMLALVLINYAKFLKNIDVKSITYGNYEVRESFESPDGTTCVKAPIIDLLPLSGIQDWTFATADYLKNGNADRFSELTRAYKKSLFKGDASGNKNEAMDLDSLAQSLKNVTDDFQTCRGLNILSLGNIAGMKKKLEQFDRTVIEPLNPVIRKLEDSFSAFEEPSSSKVNWKNGMEAAKWCMNNHLFQQAATILQECIVTFFCIKYDLDISSEKQRKLVNGALKKKKKLHSSRTETEEREEIKAEIDNSEILQRLISDPQLSDRELYEAFSSLTDERNDINHSGMRTQPHGADRIRKNIKNAYDVFESKLLLQEEQI